MASVGVLDNRTNVSVLTLVAGTDGDDSLLGGDGDDTLVGGIGDDVLSSEGGNDVLYGDAGADILMGWMGDDALHGGDGDDVLDGGAGTDWLYGGAGSDVLIDVEGNATLDGGEGHDLLFAGSGDDILLGQAGDDDLFAGGGTDMLYGGEGNDTYRYELGDGADTLVDDAGSDTVWLGTGIDAAATVVVNDGAGNLVLSFADGGSLTLGNQLDAGTGETRATYLIEQVGFADGTIWDHAALIARAQVQAGDASTMASASHDVGGMGMLDSRVNGLVVAMSVFSAPVVGLPATFGTCLPLPVPLIAVGWA